MSAGLRARVASFVFSRIGPTRFFLERELSADETCILLTRCFEQLASFSRQPNSHQWIKPVFKERGEQYAAEKGFQDQVFYPVRQAVAEHAKFIAHLNTKSEIQKDLQEYIATSPITVKFEHFQTELCNPNYSHLPLKILQASTRFVRLSSHHQVHLRFESIPSSPPSNLLASDRERRTSQLFHSKICTNGVRNILLVYNRTVNRESIGRSFRMVSRR